MVKQNKSQAPKGDDGEDLVPMSEGPMQNSKPGDHRDAFKKIIKEMMNPNKQQSGGGGQPHIIEIDPSTPEGEEQLKEIMKMMNYRFSVTVKRKSFRLSEKIDYLKEILFSS